MIAPMVNTAGCISQTSTNVTLKQYPPPILALLQGDNCNCTNLDLWQNAVYNPDPHNSQCQFPQVIITNFYLSYYT